MVLPGIDGFLPLLDVVVVAFSDRGRSRACRGYVVALPLTISGNERKGYPV
jgi:hypothetical protein